MLLFSCMPTNREHTQQEPQDHQDDSALVQRALEAKSEPTKSAAWADIQNKYRKDMEFTIQRFIHRESPDFAEVLQTAFQKAWTSLSQYSGDRPLGSWLRSIARNAALDLLRRAHKKKEIAFQVLEGGLSAETTLPTTEPNPEEALLSTLMKEATEEALQAAEATLTEAELQAWTMHAKQDMTFAAIAEKLGLKTPGVASRIYRAQQKMIAVLRARLIEEDEDKGQAV